MSAHDELIAGYRRQIVRLTEERNAARAELKEEREKHRAEVDLLSAQLREGTSAQVEALRRMVRTLTARNDRQARTLQAMAR